MAQARARGGKILMVYIASTHARAKRVAPYASHEASQTKAMVAKPLNTSPPPTTNVVGML
jgi:hypothetical protein